MTKPATSTCLSAEADASDERRRKQQLAVARNLIIAGIELAFQVTGSGLQALAETETAMGAFLAAHNPEIAAEVVDIKTVGRA